MDREILRDGIHEGRAPKRDAKLVWLPLSRGLRVKHRGDWNENQRDADRVIVCGTFLSPTQTPKEKDRPDVASTSWRVMRALWKGMTEEEEGMAASFPSLDQRNGKRNIEHKINKRFFLNS